jgi:hypothetical protein
MLGASIVLPDDFADHLTIANAAQRFDEAAEVAQKVTAAGVHLRPSLDHAAIFCDPPHLVAGPLKHLGYIMGWDARCYPSPVDGCDYINVSARLSPDSPARQKGWFDYVAVVYPVDRTALDHMLAESYGNPFIHHLTWGIVPPETQSENDFDKAGQVVPFMVKTRNIIGSVIGQPPGTLIIALPAEVIDCPYFAHALKGWLGELSPGEYQIESMQGGGFLIQFFVLTGGRIEVALRMGTTQTFHPQSVHKISKDEISTLQGE